MHTKPLLPGRPSYLASRFSLLASSNLALRFSLLALLVGVVTPTCADLRVQDVARLQGQRTNKLTGFGLVIGLDGTGDGAKSPATLRALMELHKVFHAPVLDVKELQANNNVAIVSVEVTIPEVGAREGEALDAVVSCIGPAKSLKSGRLLTTPMQDSMLTIPSILALTSGRVEQLDPKNPKVGVIRGGCVLEEDFSYGFVKDGSITLVLDDSKAGYGWAQVVARAVNFELANPTEDAKRSNENDGRIVVDAEAAEAISARCVRVQIPPAEARRPAAFIARVLAAKVFAAPDAVATVVINRTTNQISFTESVVISPTVLQLPGLGTVSVGGGGSGGQNAPAGSMVGLDSEKAAGTSFQELLTTLSKLQLPPEQVVQAVEHLHRTGTLHARLMYTE
ncbi:MAG: flagellar basal body P-ring protein FlgI [Planctomycetes bacterium]|nr:flagellar basal body P-ring protein FlgI [Planctomycetota bacterium]